ncbi:MAG: sulfate transporter [Verrucomicrobia bacterium]|nr:sulfate transporter [Verrucomicrobiota bacterium]
MFASQISSKNIFSQILAGIVVFLVALPLSLGIALASGVPLVSGLLGAMVGGLLIGVLSGSEVSVSGPSAALASIIVQQIARLHSFEAFLLALFFSGLIQLIMGFFRAGFIAEFFPTSVIKGLLVATGLLIALKQIPHLVGYDTTPFGYEDFLEADGDNTFSEIIKAFTCFQPGALMIGLLSLVILTLWEVTKSLKKIPIPGALLVVVIAIVINKMFLHFGSSWVVVAPQLVQIPQVGTVEAFLKTFKFPDTTQLFQPAIYGAAIMLALSASLETLLNLEATDKIDPNQRVSSPHRELMAQGIGNMFLGLIGGMPVTCAVVRSSANIDAGGRYRLATIVHGLLLMVSVLFLPSFINQIPLSVLAAILVVVGFKLAAPRLFINTWNEGPSQFLPFIITVIGIIFTNFLIGVLIGLCVSLLFLLYTNWQRPVVEVLEKHAAGEVLRIALGNQVSFLNRPSLAKALNAVAFNSHLLLDARNTDYIDPDILSLIHDFLRTKAKVRNIVVSLLGFKKKYSRLKNVIHYVDYSTQELQSKLTPAEVITLLKEGNERFQKGTPLFRDYRIQVQKTAHEQYPMGVVLSCIDSRAPVEMIFDAGLGDLFSIQMAGQVAHHKELANMEYGCMVAGAKLIVVLGHSSCGAVRAAVDFFQRGTTALQETGSKHLDLLLQEIQKSMDANAPTAFSSDEAKTIYIDEIARRYIMATIYFIHQESPALHRLAQEGKIAIVGAFYDVATGRVEWL